MSERQIEDVLRKEKGVDTGRPTYTKMSRRHLSIETLNKYRIDYEFDVVRCFVMDFRQGLTRFRILTTSLSNDGFQVRNPIPPAFDQASCALRKNDMVYFSGEGMKLLT